MKVAIAQLNYHTGNFEYNSGKIIDAIESVKGKADLIVFAELAICGYPPRDFLEFEDFIDLCEAHIHRIASHCQGIHAIVGAPSRNKEAQGKRLFNSAYVLGDGKVKEVVSKTLLPTYDIFDEYRYFEPNQTSKLVEIDGHKVALTICEDLWNVGNSKLYPSTPMDALKELEPHVMVNIAASPFSAEQADKRKKVLQANATQYELPLVYVNHVGAQTELIFDGDSQVLNASGELLHSSESFQESIDVVDVFAKQTVKWRASERIEKIHDALVLGIHDYFKKLGLKKAILGLSGGIDSAVVCALAARALGPENVMSVLLPSQYTADASVSEAINLANNQGSPYKIIPIKDVFGAFESELTEHFEGKPSDVTEENLQARSRGVMLMALSNKLGYILLNTTNKSEMAVGYGTLYGDLCGGISVIGDVYKTDVFALARYINKDHEIIPEFIITRPPSAELKEDQQDTDSLPPYSELDPILKHYIEERLSPNDIVELGYDEKTVRRVIKLINTSEWKRHQTAPILRVSEKAFGMGRRMPIVAKYLS